MSEQKPSIGHHHQTVQFDNMGHIILTSNEKIEAIDSWRNSKHLPIGGRVFTDMCIVSSQQHAKSLDEIRHKLQDMETCLHMRLYMLEHKIDQRFSN